MIKRHGWDCLSFSSSLIQHYVFSLYFWISPYQSYCTYSRHPSLFSYRYSSHGMSFQVTWSLLESYWCHYLVCSWFLFLYPCTQVWKTNGTGRGRRGEAWDREWWDSFIYGPPVFFSSMLPPLPSSSSLFLNPGRKRIASSPCEINKISGESPSSFICYGNRPSKWKIR